MSMEKIIKSQKAYFLSGETKNLDFRLFYLKKLKQTIKQYEKEILETLAKDLAKAPFEAYMTELMMSYASLDLTIKRLKTWAKPKKVKTPIYHFGKSTIAYEPYGMVLVLSPFNYPFQLTIEPLIGALAAGNTVILKPSEHASKTAKVLENLIKKTFPPHYVAVINGDASVANALLKERFDYVFFTGSPAIGKLVMKACSENLVPLTLELGGKSPVIVDEIASLDLAAKRIIWGKLLNCGQTCIAPDYVLVKDKLKAPLIEAMKKAIFELYGNRIKENGDYGRIINQRHTERLVDILKKDSEAIVFGGAYDLEACYVAPTLLDLKSAQAAAMQEEFFGPILPIIGYQSLSDAIDLVRGYEKPLALYIFSNDKETIAYLEQAISSGNITINDTIKHASLPNLPFGGVGHSGMGRYHGQYSFETFSHARGIYENRAKWDIVNIYPPYKSLKEKFFRKVFSQIF